MNKSITQSTYLVKVPITHVNAQTIAALIPSFENIQKSIYPNKDQNEIHRSVFQALKGQGFIREDIRLALVIDEIRGDIQYIIEEKNTYDTGQYINGVMVNLMMVRNKVGKEDYQAMAIQTILGEGLIVNKGGYDVNAEELKSIHEARRTKRMTEMVGA